METEHDANIETIGWRCHTRKVEVQGDIDVKGEGIIARKFEIRIAIKLSQPLPAQNDTLVLVCFKIYTFADLRLSVVVRSFRM